MKQKWVICMAVCAMFSFADKAHGQSLKDLLNSSKVKNAVTAVTGGKSVTVENIAGSWSYINPAVQLEGDNALKNVAGSVATSEIENKLKEQCKKVGIVAGAFSYEFKEDGTFTNTMKGKKLSGTYTVDTDKKTVTLKYGKTDKIKIGTMKANVVISGSEMSLLFDADKLLALITKLSQLSSNTTLQTLSKLSSQYNGMQMGFRLKK